MNAVVASPAPLVPGVFENVPMAEYLRMPAVSAHILKVLLDRCPAAARYESWLNPNPEIDGDDDDDNDAKRAGTIAHSGLLEGNFNFVAVIDPRDHPNEKGLGYAKGWTNKSIKEARDRAIGAGKTPVLLKNFRKIEEMVAAARAYLTTVEDPAIRDAFRPDAGQSEVTMVWEEGGSSVRDLPGVEPAPQGTLCRMRPDRVTNDRRIVLDYKTTTGSAEPDAWSRTQLWKMGYYTSACFYKRGFMELFDIDPFYGWLVQEQKRPYLCSLIGLENEAIELGHVKVAYAMEIWKECCRRNQWPAYPTQVCYPELPPWEWGRFQDMRGNRNQDRDQTRDGRQKAALDAVVDALPG